MDTIYELISYCREPEPAGALLLTGEWGCGKTYIIDNNLKQELKDKAVVLRISLFGISSTNEIHRAIMIAWINAWLEIKGINKIGKIFLKMKKQAAEMDALPGLVKSIAGIDETIFFTVQNKMDEKTVILVFDDLERCRMPGADILGVINEYCENKKIHTIIVANQEKIISRQAPYKMTGDVQISSLGNNNSTNIEKKIDFSFDQIHKGYSEEIPYAEIKEKIIQRTVQYVPDYANIVNAVIENNKYCNDDYKSFVKSNEKGLLELFAPDRNDMAIFKDADSGIFGKDETNYPNRPHNIRSLKCAINDFYRVYKVLKKNKLEDLHKWFYSFTAYVISYKSGFVKEDGYGTIFTDKNIRQLYPAFDNMYMFESVKKWILHGIWDEKALSYEIEKVRERETAQKPSEIIRTNRITDIDESIIEQGFSEFLKNVYSGNLTLNDYVLFIENCCWAREYGIPFPIAVDMNEVRNGVDICIERYKNILQDAQPIFHIIGEDSREYFSDEEWNIYKHISDFALGDGVMFLTNRKLYIETITNTASAAFMVIQNKRFDVFDEEMAVVTAQSFEKDKNYGKRIFVGDFEYMWSRNVQSSDFRIHESLKGFEKLRAMLSNQYKNFQTKNEFIATAHTYRFIQAVDDIIKICNQQICI